MIPLDPVFKIFNDQEEQNHSKIDLNEDSILSAEKPFKKKTAII